MTTQPYTTPKQTPYDHLPPAARTRQIVLDLKAHDQDFEWYPTTNEMITVVANRLPNDFASILDIGAGDGRVLTKFSERSPRALLYGIEISPILIQAQPGNIIPVGTDLFEQNLSCLPVDYIFCNPIYSNFEEWVCKIIAEGFAKKAFLVIPQRWESSQLIKQALSTRGATARSIFTGDFLHAPRNARAVINIVEVTFPRDASRYHETVKDPFDIWFDQNISTFDVAEEFKESETGDELARRLSDATIDEMVSAYKTEYQRLEDHYRAIFKLDYQILRELGINKDHVREGLKTKMKGLKAAYWEVLFGKLDAITSRLTTRTRRKFLDTLTSNSSVEFTATNAYAVVVWAVKNANQYFDEQTIQLFYDLSTFDGCLNYKSNQRTWQKDGWRYGRRDEKHSHYKLDYRIVVSKWKAIKNEPYNDYEYPGNLHRDCHDLISDIRTVFGNLGFPVEDYVNSRNLHWTSGKWQNFEHANTDDILFQVKAYMNGNLHIRTLPDAIMALNVQVGRLLKWVRSEAEVVEEMGYTPAQARRFFNHNQYLTVGNVKLLNG